MSACSSLSFRSPAGWKAGKLMARKYAALRFHLPAINFPAIFGARAESESRGFRRAAETYTPAACAPRWLRPCEPEWLWLASRRDVLKLEPWCLLENSSAAPREGTRPTGNCGNCQAL